jgi:hypothetical protein
LRIAQWHQRFLAESQGGIVAPQQKSARDIRYERGKPERQCGAIRAHLTGDFRAGPVFQELQSSPWRDSLIPPFHRFDIQGD